MLEFLLLRPKAGAQPSGSGKSGRSAASRQHTGAGRHEHLPFQFPGPHRTLRSRHRKSYDDRFRCVRACLAGRIAADLCPRSPASGRTAGGDRDFGRAGGDLSGTGNAGRAGLGRRPGLGAAGRATAALDCRVPARGWRGTRSWVAASRGLQQRGADPGGTPAFGSRPSEPAVPAPATQEVPRNPAADHEYTVPGSADPRAGAATLLPMPPDAAT